MKKFIIISFALFASLNLMAQTSGTCGPNLTWTIVGSGGLMENRWAPTDTTNDMVTSDSIVYTLVKNGCKLEKNVGYGYKVAKNHSWDEEVYGEYGGENAYFSVNLTGEYTVTFTFNSQTYTLSVSTTFTGVYNPEEKIWTIAGAPEITGTDWDITASENDMTIVREGVYILHKNNVSLTSYTQYLYKVVGNHSWDFNFGENSNIDGNSAVLSVDSNGVYDITFTFNSITKTLSANAIYKGPFSANTYYYIGSINNWSSTDKSYPFTLLDDGITWEITITSFENDGWFKIAPDYAYANQYTFWDQLLNPTYDACEALSGEMVYGNIGAWRLPQSDSIYSYTIRIVPSEMTYLIIPNAITRESDELKIFDISGADITSQVNIVWYDAQKNVIGNGSIIGGLNIGTDAFYSILLDSVLGMQYKEILFKPTTIDRTVKNDTLSPIEQVSIHGRVSAYGRALPRVKVAITQWLNGKYENNTYVLTEANGEFTKSIFNDSTLLVVTANGYMDYVKTLRNLNQEHELGDIELIEVQGKVVAISIGYQEATRTGESPVVQNWYSDTRNMEYTVRNITTGQIIDNYGLQQGNLVLPTGINQGDSIQVSVRSLNHKFASAVATGVIGGNDTANISITLLAYGSLEAIYGQKADDNLLAMLYDAAGQLVMRTICSTSRLTFSGLEAGNYTLIAMGYNGGIGAASNISDLEGMDLSEGTDYVRTVATVNDGIITTVNVASVPELDASKFEYTESNTSYLPNKMQVIAGSFITLSARVNFKEQYAASVNNVKIIVDIPDGCEFVPNSVVIGTRSLPHSLSGNKLTITLTSADIDSRIRFCMIPVQTGSFMSAAYTEFDCGGTKTQPIGQIKFQSTAGELYVPTATNTSTVSLGGIGIPKADVEIYDNESLIGTTRSLGNGKWTASCELSDAYNLSSHEIYAKYRGEGNVVGVTEAKTCRYDINAVVPKSVTMVNTAHPAGNLTPTVYQNVFDYEAIMSVKNYYLYWPDYPDFTFIIDLSDNDTTKVSDVTLYVYTTDGDKRSLSATYDESIGRFVATSSFDMYSLPVNVSVNISYLNYNISDLLYQIGFINQQFNNYDLIILDRENESLMYKIASHQKDFSVLCMYLQLTRDKENKLDSLNNRLGFIEIENDSSNNRFYFSNKGATQIISYDNDSMFVFATFDYADTLSCSTFWNTIHRREIRANRRSIPLKAFGYDPFADHTPRSTDALNNWRDHIIRDAIIAADDRLPCADYEGRIAINTAIKDLRQCVGFSIGSFLSHTLNLGSSASGRPGNAVEGAYQAWETANAARDFGAGIEGLSARGRECLRIIYSYPKCKDDDNNDDDDNEKRAEDKIPENDPSGFVYEAVPTNRVEGVTATVYYLDDETIVQWNAEEFGQINPQITDEDGLYAWDVPQGLWKVIFEKDGYETTQTDWLPVPPPQLEINVPISQAVAPSVENARGTESGITLAFSKYMRPSTLTTTNISVTRNGTNVSGHVELIDSEENPYNNEEYASKIKFVPNRYFRTSDNVIITVHKEVESYAGTQMIEDFVQQVTILSEIDEIVCDSVITVDYLDNRTLEISVLPISASKGRSISVESTSTMIAEPNLQNITLDNQGKANLVVTGNMPGNASIHLSMPEAGIDKYVKVIVVKKETGIVKTPKASKLSGSDIENDYLLTLSCATNGATIYYTLDGTSPSNEQTRIKYTGPITLPTGHITLQVIAIREGMTDSDIAIYNYFVHGQNGIELVEESQEYEVNYADGAIIITGASGANCFIYDMLGRELAYYLSIGNETTIEVPKNDVYIVNIVFANQQTIVCKVLARP